MPSLNTPCIARTVVAALAVLMACGSALAHNGGRGGWHGGHSWHGGGYARYYPGWGVYGLPPLARTILWAGVTYAVVDGIWYASGANGYTYAQPPVGITVSELPPTGTQVVINGMPHYVVNGVTYRQRPEGGYEVVNPGLPAQGTVNGADRLYIYPRNGQTANQQATDEFDCHRWAASQAGFDPSAAAVGQVSNINTAGAEYQRARAACLDGRGYTVR